MAHFLVAEAQAPDDDGVPVSVMLFASDNESTLATLDVLRMDGQPVRRLPDPGTLKVTQASSWRGEA